MLVLGTVSGPPSTGHLPVSRQNSLNWRTAISNLVIANGAPPSTPGTTTIFGPTPASIGSWHTARELLPKPAKSRWHGSIAGRGWRGLRGRLAGAAFATTLSGSLIAARRSSSPRIFFHSAIAGLAAAGSL